MLGIKLTQMKNHNAQHRVIATRHRGGEMLALTEISLHLRSKTPHLGIIFYLYHHLRFDITVHDRLHHYNVPLRLMSEGVSENEDCYLRFTYTADFCFVFILTCEKYTSLARGNGKRSKS